MDITASLNHSEENMERFQEPFMPVLSSQKAKSIWWIEKNLPFNSLPSVYLKPHQQITQDILERIEFPAFIRPCPVSPRPGRIESQPANNVESFKEIFQYLSRRMSELQEDEGDIVIQPFKSGSIANIVWTAGIMAIGPWHDGVTNGRRPTLILNALPPDFYDKALEDLCISSADIEMVIDSDMSVWVTQIRSALHPQKLFIAPGPMGAFSGTLSRSPLRVPDHSVIKIESAGSIDALCSELAQEPRKLIVFHPNGSPLSHIASVCRKNGVSYVTSDVQDAEWISEPAPGWVIKGRSLTDNYAVDYFEDDFFRGIKAGTEPVSLPEVRSIWKTILPFHHYVHQISMGGDVAYLAGAFIGNFTKLMLAVLSRQAWRLMRQRNTPPELEEQVAQCNILRTKNVLALYNHFLQIPHEDFFPCLNAFSHIIGRLGDHDTKKWQQVAETGISLGNRIEERKREDILRLTLQIMDQLRQTPWVFYRLLERDDIFALLQLGLPQSWVRTAQAWAQCIRYLEKERYQKA